MDLSPDFEVTIPFLLLIVSLVIERMNASNLCFKLFYFVRLLVFVHPNMKFGVSEFS